MTNSGWMTATVGKTVGDGSRIVAVRLASSPLQRPVGVPGFIRPVPRTGLAYLFKNFALRDMAEFLEIYGFQCASRTMHRAPVTKDRDNILEALVNLGHEAVAALPQGNEIEVQEAASGGPEAFMSMVEWAERTTSKVILGSTLTSQADGKTSTNALGNVHNEVRHDILTADARQLSGMFSSLIQI
ncbi:DUF935 family protein [Escherichia coli]